MEQESIRNDFVVPSVSFKYPQLLTHPPVPSPTKLNGVTRIVKSSQTFAASVSLIEIVKSLNCIFPGSSCNVKPVVL